jgi:multidrug efflux system outer membrane protein
MQEDSQRSAHPSHALLLGISCGWKAACRRAICSGLLFALVLTGCKVGPNFQPPPTPVPPGWVGPLPPPAPAQQSLARWWTVFNDPTLTSLADQAVASNLDLKVAEARIRQARASRQIAVSGIGPTVNATGSYTRGQTPGGPTRDEYRAGFDASWELDIFGGVRRNIEAADADLQATIEFRRGVLVTLMAEVAVNYIDIRAFQQEIVIAEENLKAQQHTAELTRQRFTGGFVSALDVANAEAQVATTASQIPLLEQAEQQAIYSLSVLLGREPGALLNELIPPATIPAGPPEVPVGVPAELLQRRPDIRQAEAQIHAATARIGVATADLFPHIFLSGSAGTQGNKFASLTDWANGFWSLGPTATWTLFATGRVRAAIELQKAFEEETLVIYRQTVLGALQEVENALIASAKEQEHRQALRDAVAANRKAVELSTTLYTQGETDFLNVLQAQRALFLSQDALVQSTRTVSTNLVALYKALGGGWQSEGQNLHPAAPAAAGQPVPPGSQP